MLHGALIVVEKDKNRDRQIEDAIQAGIKLYQKHSPNFPTLELIAYVSPRLYIESVGDAVFSLDVDENSTVPYPLMWICKRGDDK